MQYCKYHPLSAATWYCHHCECGLCDHCIDVKSSTNAKNPDEELCLSCHQTLESLGHAHSAEPFWRRLESTFKYPANTDTVIIIVGFSIINSILSIIPIFVLFQSILLGVFLKYCFNCLAETAKGNFTPPNVTTSYNEGLTLILKIFFLIFCMGMILVGAHKLGGEPFMILMALLMAGAIPAIAILLAMTDNVISSLNPVSIYQIIKAVGMPYGLIIIFIFIMLTSIDVISALTSQFTFGSTLIESAVTYYYFLVIFHLLGYMIFQYQGEFGFIAREHSGISNIKRSDDEINKAQLDVYLKDGRYQEMLDLYENIFQKQPNNTFYFDNCLKFIIASNNQEYMAWFAPIYFKHLTDNEKYDGISIVYQRISTVLPDYIPESPDVRYLIAVNMYVKGAFKPAVKLLKGFHQEFPDFEQLHQAMYLIAQSLEEIPNQENNARKYHAFSTKLAEKKGLTLIEFMDMDLNIPHAILGKKQEEEPEVSEEQAAESNEKPKSTTEEAENDTEEKEHAPIEFTKD